MNRIFRVVLMFCGVGLFGALSGLVATWFLRKAGTRQSSDLEEVLARLKAMEDRLTAGEGQARDVTTPGETP